MANADLTATLGARVARAAGAGQLLAIAGSGSKSFLGEAVCGEPLDVAGHCGIVRYAPEELVLTARAGTPLAEIEAALAERGQMLAFEPPHFGERATLGGTVAAGLSGPRRVAAGACRDFVLGVRIIDGRGQALRFGGEVIKNVAGYDVSRLMVGAFGTLGVILEVSLKVLPAPAQELTLMQAQPDPAAALQRLTQWSRRPLPITASAWMDGQLWLRLSGAPSAVAAARAELGGQPQDDGADWWRTLREHRHPWFADERRLWRLSLPPATPPLPLRGDWLLEWHGAQRWLLSDQPATAIRAAAATAGGHATLFRRRSSNPATTASTPLPAPMIELHRRLKAVLDPHGVLNPGRLYPDF